VLLEKEKRNVTKNTYPDIEFTGAGPHTSENGQYGKEMNSSLLNEKVRNFLANSQL